MQGRLRKIRIAALGAGLVVAALWLGSGLLDGPLGPLPGGPFRQPGGDCGGVDWSRLAGLREVQIEVGPASPRSVTTWSVVHAGALYLPADFLTPWKRWPHQVRADDRIRLRAEGRVLDCRAREVEDPALVATLREKIAAKYGIDPGGRAARVEVWWFEVGPR